MMIGTLEEINVAIMNMEEEYVLGHCVAKDMRMSAGIAIYFKRNFRRVGQLMDQRPNVGSVAYLQHNDRFIYYLITKEFSNGKPSYNSITAAITKLRDLIVQHNVKKLAIPRIGCGLDQLDWSTVRGIIENVFQNVGFTIKICHFTHNFSKESELLRVKHPRTKKVYKSIKDIKQGEFEKLNIILFSRKTTLPVYWDEHFQSVNEKYCFKSQYYKDYQADLEVLLPAANILQLDYVSDVCAEFLQKQLDPSNCLDIKAFADLHNCTDLLSSSEAYIKQHFLEIAKGKDFLFLSSEDLVKLISSNDLAVPFEEKVFECVIKWVKYDLDPRKHFLPELMEHVRFPLLNPDILLNISREPLLSNSSKCNNYIIEALHFNHQKSVQYFTIPKTIRCKPRQFDGSQKVILMFNWSGTSPKCYTEWYDPATKLRENAPGINECRGLAGFSVISDQFVFVMGGVNEKSSKSVSMLDVSSQSPSWVPMADMLVCRKQLGVGVLGDSIYAVGGRAYGILNKFGLLNSVEMFDVSTQKWRRVSSMTTKRSGLGVGVLNNRLYAVGGSNRKYLKSVEYYDPALDTWTRVADMSVRRYGVGVGVLDGLMYAIGGYVGRNHLKSVEVYRPSDGVWSSVADMEICRYRPGVAVLDGLLYVFGGERESSIVDTVEIYNPNTNTWTLERLSRKEAKIYGGVVVDRPHHYH